MRHFPDSFALAPEGQALVARLVVDLDEFAHLAECRIAVLASQQQPMLRGAPCQAFISTPHVQGAMRPLCDWMLSQVTDELFEGEDPDYVLVLDAALWESWTQQGSLGQVRKERLIYHELCHVVAREDADTGLARTSPMDGRVLTKLMPHDYEFFDAEVRRYGLEVCELDRAAVAIAAGYRHTAPARVA